MSVEVRQLRQVLLAHFHWALSTVETRVTMVMHSCGRFTAVPVVILPCA